MNKHTPGPWIIQTDGNALTSVTVRGGGLPIAELWHTPAKNHEANARLIATAPKLAERLAEVSNALHAACMVITDDGARKMALAMVRDARAVLTEAGIA